MCTHDLPLRLALGHHELIGGSRRRGRHSWLVDWGRRVARLLGYLLGQNCKKWTDEMEKLVDERHSRVTTTQLIEWADLLKLAPATLGPGEMKSQRTGIVDAGGWDVEAHDSETFVLQL